MPRCVTRGGHSGGDDRPSALPLAFDIAMSVRPDDHALREELDGVLERRAAEIRAVLEEFGVPLLSQKP